MSVSPGGRAPDPASESSPEEGAGSDRVSRAALQSMLREEIPLAGFMDVEVRDADETGVALWAPMGPNVNVHGTMFGGSLGSLCLLAGWTLLHRVLLAEGLPHELVVQRTRMDYLAPVTGAVDIYARTPEASVLERFLKTFRRRGRGRIQVEMEARYGGRGAAIMQAWYVALAES